MGDHIRLAEPREAPVIAALVDAAYRHYVPRIGVKPFPMVDDYDRRVANGQAWVLEQDGAIVGVLVLEEQANDFPLDNVAVAPGHQGKGHGRALIAFAEDQARARGWPSIRLYTNVLMTENQALYRALGYVEFARDTVAGRHRVQMRKALD
jgi:ribosomal protein S18 acetylase RimI-like enzyme